MTNLFELKLFGTSSGLKMTRLTLAISIILPVAAWGLMGCQGNGHEIIEDKLGSSGSSPTLRCIAPANPGSGWDFTCRTIGKIMYDNGLVDQPIQVTNMAPGQAVASPTAMSLTSAAMTRL